MTVAPADYYYVDPSSIAVARNSNSNLNIQNCVQLSDKEVICGRNVNPSTAGPNKNGLTSPVVDPVTGEVITPAKPITITRYINPFNDVDIPMDMLIPTPWERWPVRLFGDYVINVAADTFNADTGYQGGITFGRYKDPCDLFFTYAYESLDTDAVISAFSDSDFGPHRRHQRQGPHPPGRLRRDEEPVAPVHGLDQRTGPGRSQPQLEYRRALAGGRAHQVLAGVSRRRIVAEK